MPTTTFATPQHSSVSAIWSSRVEGISQSSVYSDDASGVDVYTLQPHQHQHLTHNQ